MKTREIRIKIKAKGLRVTPQRVSILEAIIELDNHPTADNIIEFIKKHHPNIASGTVYKVLDTLIEKGLINKVMTDRDIKRYDAILETHHHLYCTESDRIEDYFDKDLNEMIASYFERKGIQNLEIEDIKLQIIGKFMKTNK